MTRAYVGPDPATELPLLGGDVTEGVVRAGDTVRRPSMPGSDAVADYLDHLQAGGFDRAPRFLGRDRCGRDVLTYVEGDVPGPALPPWAVTDEALATLARLQRRLHDASAGYRPAPGSTFPRDLVAAPRTPLPPSEPVLVTHNDITPQNVVFRAGAPWGLIDFDLAGPTTALTDLATTCQYWIPLLDPVDADPVFAGVDVRARLRLFLDAYGLPPRRHDAFLGAAALRYDGSWASMHWRAEHLGGGWQRMWDAGVGDLIARRARWFEQAAATLL